jgi:hypothetical protein
MNKLQIRWMLFVFALKDLPHYVKCLMWNRGLRLLWCKLWIRKDEFHSSLEMDLDAMWYMSSKQVSKYLEDLTNRRRIAHERDTFSK